MLQVLKFNNLDFHARKRKKLATFLLIRESHDDSDRIITYYNIDSSTINC